MVGGVVVAGLNRQPVVVASGVAAPGGYWDVARGRRRLTRGEDAGRRRGSGWERTAADEAVLQTTGRFGGMLLRQTSKHFYGGVEVTAKRRIGYMVDTGLLNRSDSSPWAGSVLWPTGEGMRAAHSAASDVPLDAPPAMPSDERLMHQMLVVDWVLDNHHWFTDGVLSEREFRTLERSPTDTAAADFAAQAGLHAQPVRQGERRRWFFLPMVATEGGSLHCPDLIGIRGGALHAVEVEVSVKKKDRLLRALNAYKRAFQAGQFMSATWLVTPPVRAVIEGWLTPAGEWRPGLLADPSLRMIDPAGPIPEGSPFRLVDVTTDDTGLQYALDQKSLPPSARCGLSTWKLWRSLWERDAPENMPFTEWVTIPEVAARLALAAGRRLIPAV